MRDFLFKNLKVGDRVIVALPQSTKTCDLYEGWVHHFAKRGVYEVAEVVFMKNDLQRPWEDIYYKRGFSSGKICKLPND